MRGYSRTNFYRLAQRRFGPISAPSSAPFRYAGFDLPFADLGDGRVDVGNNINVAATFTRATGATTVDRNGRVVLVANDVPRSWYDPTTREYLGFMAENTRVNLITRSEELDNVAWSGTAIVTPNTHIAPDGTLTADTLTDNSAVSFMDRAQAFAVADDTLRHVFSVFIRKTFGGTSPTFAINMAYTGGVTIASNARFNSDTGVLIGVSGLTYSKVVSYGDYWRVSCGLNNNATGNTNLGVLLFPASNFHGLATDDVAGVGSAVVWGAQLEKANFESTYIPTIAIAVQRNIDVLTYPTAPWYNALEGTLFSQQQLFAATSTPNPFSIYDGTINERMSICYSTAGVFTPTWIIHDGGVQQVNIPTGIEAFADETHRIAAVYRANDFAIAFNGSSAFTVGAGTLPTVTTAIIGAGIGGALGSNFGPIKRCTYWPFRMTDAMLQQLTQG